MSYPRDPSESGRLREATHNDHGLSKDVKEDCHWTQLTSKPFRDLVLKVVNLNLAGVDYVQGILWFSRRPFCS
jgi:hypothetical protein